MIAKKQSNEGKSHILPPTCRHLNAGAARAAVQAWVAVVKLALITLLHRLHG